MSVPPPVAKAIRRRSMAELAILVLFSMAYLVLIPERPLAVDAMFALLGLGAVGLTAKETRRLWGSPNAPALTRLRRCGREMTLFTVPVVLLFIAHATVSAGVAEGHGVGVPSHLFRGAFFVILIAYVPWAWLQQTLFQFYLLARLRALVPRASPLALSCANGILFGAVHFPAWDVALVTMGGGAVWSYSYCRDRSLLPISLSHAVLGATYFQWVRAAASW